MSTLVIRELGLCWMTGHAMLPVLRKHVANFIDAFLKCCVHCVSKKCATLL